jgi:CTP:molybdopterin cytidylyltransferase MocA
MQCAAIVLAAGASSRMGRPKQLLRITEDESLIERAIRLAHEAGCLPVIVVLGAHADAIREQAHLPAVIVENSAWADGVAGSIRTGVAAAGQADAALLLACDQPAVSAQHLRTMLLAAEQHAIVASTYAGVTGIPAAFSRKYFDELMALSGDSGARSLLVRHAVHSVPLAGGEADLDRPEDLPRSD